MQEFDVAGVGRFPTVRMRRNRRHRWTREMVAEQHLTAKDFIWPVFVHGGPEPEVPVPSMPGVVRYSLDAVVDAVGHAVELGIPAIAIFPATDPSKKTPLAEEALNPDNLVCQALRSLKQAFGNDVGLLADVASTPIRATDKTASSATATWPTTRRSTFCAARRRCRPKRAATSPLPPT